MQHANYRIVSGGDVSEQHAQVSPIAWTPQQPSPQLLNVSATPSASLSETVQLVMASVDVQTSKLRHSLLESEGKRVTLEQAVRLRDGSIQQVLERALDAELQLEGLRGEASGAHTLKIQLDNAISKLEVLSKDHQHITRAHEESLKLLQSFEKDHELEKLEWKHANETLLEEKRVITKAKLDLSLRLANAEAVAKRHADADAKLKQTELHLKEASSRCTVLDGQLKTCEERLRQAAEREDKHSAKVGAQDRMIHNLQRELSSEQLRTHQLQGLVDLLQSRTARLSEALLSADKKAVAMPLKSTQLSSPPVMLSPSRDENTLGSSTDPSSVADPSKYEMDLLMSHNAELQAEVQKYRESQRALDQQLREVEKERRELQRTYDDLSAKWSTVVLERSADKQRILELESQVSRQADNLVLAQQELAKVSSLRESLGVQSTSLLQATSVLQHEKSRLEVAVMERDNDIANLKASSLQFVHQMQVLTTRVSDAAKAQEAAEEEAAKCRKTVVEARTAQWEADYHRCAAEEQCAAVGSTIIVMLSSLASAEDLAVKSTAEAAALRRQMAQQRSEVESVLASRVALCNELEAAHKRIVTAEELAQRLRSELHVANETAQRASLLRDEASAKVDLLTRAAADLNHKVEAQQNLCAAQDATFKLSSQRLALLAGEYLHESSLDDVVQAVHKAASDLKAIAASCDAVQNNAPAFYSSLTTSLSRGAQAVTPQAVGHDPVDGRGPFAVSDDDKYYLLFWAGVDAGQGGGQAPTRSAQMSGPWIDPALLSAVEFSWRMEIVAHESNEVKNMFGAIASCLAQRADFRYSVDALSAQLQSSSEHASRLLRSVKVLRRKQMDREHSAIGHYQLLEKMNAVMWQRTQQLHDIYWRVLDSELPSELRVVIRSQLRDLAPVPDAWMSHLTNNNGEPSGASLAVQSGDMVAQLKYDNDCLIAEAVKSATQVALVEANAAALVQRNAELNRLLDAAALSLAALQQGSPDPPGAQRALPSYRDSHRRGALGGAQQVSATMLEFNRQLQDRDVHLSRLCARLQQTCSLDEVLLERLTAFMEHQLEAVHWVATQHVYDVCVLASFARVLSNSSVRTERPRGAPHDTETQTAVSGDDVAFREQAANGEQLDCNTTSPLWGTSTAQQEASARLMLVEHSQSVLIASVRHAMNQMLHLHQSEVARVTSTLQQAQSMSEGELHVDHKHQLVSYAKTIDEYNARLSTFMKAKAASDQEAQRLRTELRSTQDLLSSTKRDVAVLEQQLAEMHMIRVELQDVNRINARDIEQLRHKVVILSDRCRFFEAGGSEQSSYSPRTTRPDRLHAETQTVSSAPPPSKESVVAPKQQWFPSAPPVDAPRVTVSHSTTPSAAENNRRPAVSSNFSPFFNDAATCAAHTALSTSEAHRSVTCDEEQRHNQAVMVVKSITDSGASQRPQLSESSAKAPCDVNPLAREVAWTIKERQLRALEREVTIRLQDTTRECVALKYELQTTKASLCAVIRIIRPMHRSRRLHCVHLRAWEHQAMLVEDVASRCVSSASLIEEAATSQSTNRVSSHRTATQQHTVAAEEMQHHELAAPNRIRDDTKGTSWWSSTKSYARSVLPK